MFRRQSRAIFRGIFKPNHTHHFTSRHFTYAPSIPTEIHFLATVTVFLTLFLKVLNKHGRDASKPAGN
jgi:hypothetical protein